MKCARCGHDCKRSERSDGKCPQCKLAFAFEPQDHKITDVAFQNLLTDLSAHDTLKYTRGQLYHAFNLRLGHKISPSLGGGLGCLLGIGVVIMIAGFVGVILERWISIALLAVGLSFVAFSIVGARKQKRTISIPWAKFDEYLERWTNAFGRPKGLLSDDTQKTKKPKALPEDRKKEFAHYSFDRMLIVERDAIAAMLIENRFHFENNCAILSLEGFPGPDAREVVLAMAKQNAAIKVFLAHDASVDGCNALERLRRQQWLHEKIPVADLGLRPAQVLSMKRPMILAGGTPIIGSDLAALTWLDPKERKWLGEGNSMSLDALPPAALMRALHQGFARAQMLEKTSTDDGSLVLVDSTSPVIWTGSSNFDQYASDSFG